MENIIRPEDLKKSVLDVQTSRRVHAAVTARRAANPEYSLEDLVAEVTARGSVPIAVSTPTFGVTLLDFKRAALDVAASRRIAEAVLERQKTSPKFSSRDLHAELVVAREFGRPVAPPPTSNRSASPAASSAKASEKPRVADAAPAQVRLLTSVVLEAKAIIDSAVRLAGSAASADERHSSYRALLALHENGRLGQYLPGAHLHTFCAARYALVCAIADVASNRVPAEEGSFAITSAADALKSTIDRIVTGGSLST